MYEEGISSSMQIFSSFTTGSNIAAVTSSETSDYIAAHLLNSSGTMNQQMNQIHTQLWVALLLNEIEAFANWRRTGFPELIPINYPGNQTGGSIPRRLRYSENEIGSNSANYAAAVARQGPDEFTTRVWWDKP